MGIRSADGGTGHNRRLSSKEVGVFYNKKFKGVSEEEQEIKAQHFKIALANVTLDQTLNLFTRKNLTELASHFILYRTSTGHKTSVDRSTRRRLSTIC